MGEEERKLDLGKLYAILVDGPIAIWRYFKDHEARIKALEEWARHPTPLCFSQRDLDAAVKAERERIEAEVFSFGTCAMFRSSDGSEWLLKKHVVRAIRGVDALKDS